MVFNLISELNEFIEKNYKKEIKKENKKETTNVANANGFVVRPNVALHTTYTIKPATTN